VAGLCSVPNVSPSWCARTPNFSYGSMTSCRIQEYPDLQVHPGRSDRLAPWALWALLDRSALSERLDCRGSSEISPPSVQLTLPACSSRSLAPSGRFSAEIERLSDFQLYQPYRLFPRRRRCSSVSRPEVQPMFPLFSARPKILPVDNDLDSRMMRALASSKRSTSFYANSSPNAPDAKPWSANAKSFEQDLTRSSQLSRRGMLQSNESSESGG